MMEKPCLRNLVLSPYTPPRDASAEEDEDTVKAPNSFLLDDPEGFSPPMVLPVTLAILVSLMDGNRTLEQIRYEFQDSTQEQVSLEDLAAVVEHFDALHFLDSPAFAAFLKHEMDTFAQALTRPAMMAGGAYPREPETLRKRLQLALETPGKIHASTGEGTFEDAFPKNVRAALVPHIDLERGMASYGWAYQALGYRCDADVLVIFGTAHNPMREKFAFTTKAFETPLGLVDTDTAFIARAAERFREAYAQLPGDPNQKERVDLFADEFVHRDEHSVEFQAIFLRKLAEETGRNVRIVPILVNSFVPFLSDDEMETPGDNDVVRLFLDALWDTAAEQGLRVAWLAAADLSHIGPMYGSPAPVDADAADALREQDTELLQTVRAVDSGAFWRNIAANQNARQVCGVGAIYCMLKMAQRAGCRHANLLCYEQAVDEDTRSCVTFATLAAGVE